MRFYQSCGASGCRHGVDLNGSISSPTSAHSLFSVYYLLRNMCGCPGGGLVSKINIADNISARPFLSVLGSYGDTSLYIAGASVTYDFSLSNAELTPYAGLGYGFVGITNGVQSANLGSSTYGELGADYNVAESITINGNYKYFFSSGGGNALGLGAAYRF